MPAVKPTTPVRNAPGAPKSPKPPAVEGLKVGKTATKELFDFMACFQAMAEKSETGETLRIEGFKSADPNGNGLCSLAELETFILKTLMTAYPKDKTTKVEKGRDLFDLYRPCMIRAFKDAADYAKDDGTTIKGTKTAKQDDFVSKEEFRLFCAYLCIYATMYDAFSKIDGGGAGRVGDDRRIDMAEWLAGYKGVSEHGFLALQGIENKETATCLFQEIDNNGGGYILLEEWCEYIKAKEINTPLGAILSEDEEGGVGKKWTPPTSPSVSSPNKITTPKRRNSKKKPLPKNNNNTSSPLSKNLPATLTKAPSTGEGSGLIVMASTGDWERDKEELARGERRSAVLLKTQKLLNKKKQIDADRAQASAVPVELTEEEKKLNGAPEGALFNAVIIEKTELSGFADLSEEDILTQIQSCLMIPLGQVNEVDNDEEVDNGEDVAWNVQFEALTFLRRVLLHSPHLLHGKVHLLCHGIANCCRNSRSILAKNAVITTEELFALVMTSNDSDNNEVVEIKAGLLDSEGIALLINALIELSSSTTSKILRSAAQSALLQLFLNNDELNTDTMELLVTATKLFISHSSHKNKDCFETAMVSAEKSISVLSNYKKCDFQKVFDLNILISSLTVGINGKSPIGKKSARECCVILANQFTPSVFSDIVAQSELTDVEKEELIAISCPIPIQPVVEKKEENYLDRRKRELEKEEEEMDIFVKKFLSRLGFSEEAILNVEKMGVRCFSDLNDLAIQDDAIELMEKAGLKKIEARKLLGEMSKRISDEKQRKLELKIKEETLAALKEKEIQEKLHEERIKQLALEKKQKREELELFAAEEKAKKLKLKEEEEFQLNQTKSINLEKWNNEKNNRKKSVELGDVFEGSVDVPVKGRMGMISHKPRYAIFDTSTCIFKTYDEGNMFIISEHFIVCGQAINKGKVGLMNKKYRVDVPIMSVESASEIKQKLKKDESTGTLFVVQGTDKFVPHEMIAQYHFQTSALAEQWCYYFNGKEEGNIIVNERRQIEEEKEKEIKLKKEIENQIQKEENIKIANEKKHKKELEKKEKNEKKENEKKLKLLSPKSNNKLTKELSTDISFPNQVGDNIANIETAPAASAEVEVEVAVDVNDKEHEVTPNTPVKSVEESTKIDDDQSKSPKTPKGSRLSLTKALGSVTKGMKSPLSSSRKSTSSSRASNFFS